MSKDLFGNKILEHIEVIELNIYSDEIQLVVDRKSGEEWIYMGAVYEVIGREILEDLIDVRFCRDKESWEDYKEQNNTAIHWKDLGTTKSKYFIVERWLQYILDDCVKGRRKFHFSILGINTSNLDTTEFAREQNFNSIYNRFYRSMLTYSIKKFFVGKNVVIDNVYHEEGQQAQNEYFDWHTLFKLSQNENFHCKCDKVEFLPKDHRQDERSNVIQLCDVLLGIFKDLHLGINHLTYPSIKKQILDSELTQELLIKRVINNPGNINSSYGHSKRFNISLFPNKNTSPESLHRTHTDNFYEVDDRILNYQQNPNQGSFVFY